MANRTPSKTTNALVGLPFENIIGSPLDAAIKAQAMSANTTIAFIKEVGFIQDARMMNLSLLVAIQIQDLEIYDM